MTAGDPRDEPAAKKRSASKKTRRRRRYETNANASVTGRVTKAGYSITISHDRIIKVCLSVRNAVTQTGNLRSVEWRDGQSGVAVALKIERGVEPGPEVFQTGRRRRSARDPSRKVALIRQTKGVGKKRTNRR